MYDFDVNNHCFSPKHSNLQIEHWILNKEMQRLSYFVSKIELRLDIILNFSISYEYNPAEILGL